MTSMMLVSGSARGWRVIGGRYEIAMEPQKYFYGRHLD